MTMRKTLSKTAIVTVIVSSSWACQRAPTPRASAPVQTTHAAQRDAGHQASPGLQATEPTRELSQFENDWERALAAKDWDAVCLALEFTTFDPEICAWISRKARDGVSGPPNARILEAFFRRQRVARTSGSIVALLQERPNGDTYEVRVGGRSAFLDTMDTNFSTTGGFRMWTQRQEDEEVTMQSGTVRTVAAYLEWPLADDILGLARVRGDDARSRAERLFAYLHEQWILDVSPTIEVADASEWPTFLAERRAGVVDPGTGSVGANAATAGQR